MKSKYLFTWSLAALGAVLISGTAWAQSSGTVNNAFQVARQAVNPSVQNKVVSLYGIGTPSSIEKWYIIFYDPSVASHGRAVLVENNQITKTYPANGGVTYSSSLTFDPSRITSEGPALSAAEGYAAKHDIAYNSVRVLLRQTSVNKPFRWRVELLAGGKSEGFVFVNALDDTVAYYAGPSSEKKSSGSSDNSVEGFANDVKNTFLGIGGDLQEFFTGERTVDK
ncbi:MAG: hypothetical protein LV480_07280 [Methylacidiphilales bacterium]|nr:hypothetical protein [Candidatus Methylacidiphilales bacterium]